MRLELRPRVKNNDSSAMVKSCRVLFCCYCRPAVVHILSNDAEDKEGWQNSTSGNRNCRRAQALQLQYYLPAVPYCTAVQRPRTNALVLLGGGVHDAIVITTTISSFYSTTSCCVTPFQASQITYTTSFYRIQTRHLQSGQHESRPDGLDLDSTLILGFGHCSELPSSSIQCVEQLSKRSALRVLLVFEVALGSYPPQPMF